MQLRALVVFLVAVAALLGGAPARADENDRAGGTPTGEAKPTEAAASGEGKPPEAADAKPAEAEPSESSITARASAEVAGYIDSVATTVLTPSVGGSVESPTAGWSVNGRYLLDVVSAASPDIVSTASPPFKEIRQGGSLGGRYKPGDFGVGANASISYSPDYLAIAGGGSATLDLDQKNLTLLTSYSYGHDTIGRTGTSFSVFSRDLAYHMLTFGAARVLNPSTTLSLIGDAVIERGDQSKPYRYIPIFSPEAAAKVPRGLGVDSVVAGRLQARPLEQLPLERERYALTARLAWRFERSTLRVDQRGYLDTWGLLASTTDLRYFIDVTQRLMFWPHLRFHAQKGVSFWKLAYSSTGIHDLPALRTGDRELGPLTNLGVGGGLRLALGRAGRTEDVTLSTTFDGTWTSFADTLYVKDRFSVLVTTALGVTF